MKYLGYLIAILATVFVVLLFIQNRDLKQRGEDINHQKQEITLKLESKEAEEKKLNDKVSVLRDSLLLIDEKLSYQDAQKRSIIRNYERRLREVEEMTQVEVDSFLLANYPDDRDIVRDLVAYSHCLELVTNKDGEIQMLENKVLILDAIVFNQDSIIQNLSDRLVLKDEMIAKIEEGHKIDLKKVKRQRNVAYGIGGGMFIIAIAALL